MTHRLYKLTSISKNFTDNKPLLRMIIEMHDFPMYVYSNGKISDRGIPCVNLPNGRSLLLTYFEYEEV